MNYIFVSAGYEITRESHLYGDWQCRDYCNSMEGNSTQSSWNVIDGRKQHKLPQHSSWIMSLFPTQSHFAHKTNKTKFNLPNCVSTCLLSFKTHSAHITHSRGSPARQTKPSTGNMFDLHPPFPSLILNFQPFFVSDGSFIWNHDKSIRIKLYQEKTSQLGFDSFSGQFQSRTADSFVPLCNDQQKRLNKTATTKIKFSMGTRKMMGERQSSLKQVHNQNISFHHWFLPTQTGLLS